MMALGESQTLQGTVQNDTNFLKNSLTTSRAYKMSALLGPAVKHPGNRANRSQCCLNGEKLQTTSMCTYWDDKAPPGSVLRGSVDQPLRTLGRNGNDGGAI